MRLIGASPVGRSARAGRGGAALASGGSRGGSGRGAGALQPIAASATCTATATTTAARRATHHCRRWTPRGPACEPADLPAPDRIVLSLPRGAFHALAWGDAAAPPLLWLHGFPDHPPTAAPFLARLARLAPGRRVIAPWLRGYAPSPLGGPYDLETLAEDVIAILSRIAGDGGRADMIGHDWGAAIAYRVCAVAPERVRRAVTLALPHPRTFLRALRRPAQLRRSWYMLLFQAPGAGWIARARGLALIDHLWRTWSPRFTLDGERRAELHACLEASLPAPLEYYRAMVRPLAAAAARTRRLARPIATPLLQLHGADDGCILPPTDADRWLFVDRVLEVVPNAGHFLHLEDPAAIAARVAAWLA
jgi:pimeloyl-ACP methyl ester carboxylesterase